MRQRLVAKQRDFLAKRLPQSFAKRQSFARLFSFRSASGCLTLFWVLAALSFADMVWAQRKRGAPPQAWRTAMELAKHLDEPVTWSWSGQSLSAALTSLAETDRLSSFLDRRVDPGLKLDVTLVDTPLRQALERVAEKVSLGSAVLGPVIYWGPADSAARLRTLAETRREDADQLRPQLRLALSSSRPLAWPRLSTPRELAAQLAAEVDLKLADENALPHDLWPAVDLPPLPWTDRLTLVLAGFGLTYEIDEERNLLRFVPAPAEPMLARTFPLRGGAEKTLAAWKEQAPQAQVRVRGGRLEARGRLEDFERMTAKRSTTAKAPRRPTQQVYRLNIVAQDKAVGSLVRQLAERLGWQAEFDDEAIKKAGLSLERPVSVSAEGATPEELFREVLGQAGLGFRIEGETIRVFPPRVDGAK